MHVLAQRTQMVVFLSPTTCGDESLMPGLTALGHIWADPTNLRELELRLAVVSI
jgi:hypothetical protein